MPRRTNPIHAQILGSLIEAKDASWNRKVLGDKDGKQVESTVKMYRACLRYPLARNVNEDNVNRTAKRWSR
jgi:hypothetical protein